MSDESDIAGLATAWQDFHVSNKEIVMDLVQRLPEKTTLLEIAREIEFIAGVREGFDQLDHGEGLPIEEVEKQLPTWTSK